MDPITQGALGAVVSQGVARVDRYKMGLVCLLGFLSGMAADLDVLIRSSDDPLLFLKYHRQFTHSLIFIPVGGVLCASLWHVLVPKSMALPWRQTWAVATLGYATHALLDACTSYGTQLFWPFSAMRISWNNVSIVDPLFTLPLLALMALTVVKQNPRFARIAMLYGLCYLLLGVVQGHRAKQAGLDLAQARGHAISTLVAKPSFANLMVWRTIYEYDGRFYVDAVRVGVEKKRYQGSSIAKLNLARDFPWLKKDSQQAKDVARFAWVSEGILAKDPRHENRIMDVRYAAVPNQIKPLWEITLDPNKPNRGHASYDNPHETLQQGAAQDFKQAGRQLWQMILGRELL